MKECRISTECIGIYFKRYFSRGGEIRHDNTGLSRVPLSSFHSGSILIRRFYTFRFYLGQFRLWLFEYLLYGLIKVVFIICREMIKYA